VEIGRISFPTRVSGNGVFVVEGKTNGTNLGLGTDSSEQMYTSDIFTVFVGRAYNVDPATVIRSYKSFEGRLMADHERLVSSSFVK